MRLEIGLLKMISCKLLSPDHIMVVLQINHPAYGRLTVDTFQRKIEGVLEDIEKKEFESAVKL